MILGPWKTHYPIITFNSDGLYTQTVWTARFSLVNELGLQAIAAPRLSSHLEDEDRLFISPDSPPFLRKGARPDQVNQVD